MTAMHAIEASEVPADDPEPDPALQILIANEQATLSIDLARIRSAVRAVLSQSSYCTGEVSVAIVDDETIHRLNREYLQHDYPTDVLSFSLAATGSHLEGELILSADTATRNAPEYGWSPAEELLLYAIHGALHLIGYGDGNSADAAAMRAAEADHLRKIGIALPANQSRWSANAHFGGRQSEGFQS